MHFYWLWALLIVPQGCWIDTFWLVHLSRRGSLLRCLNPVKEKFRFLNFFSFFLNWPMKNFYFFIFKKSRDLTGRLHFLTFYLTVCWQKVVLGPCSHLVVVCLFARYCAYDCTYFFAKYFGKIFIRSWVLFLCVLLCFLFSYNKISIVNF